MGYTRARLVKVVVVTKDVENRQGILPDTSAFPVDGGHSNAGKLHLVRLESGEHLGQSTTTTAGSKPWRQQHNKRDDHAHATATAVDTGGRDIRRHLA